MGIEGPGFAPEENVENQEGETELSQEQVDRYKELQEKGDERTEDEEEELGELFREFYEAKQIID